jgi:hypothetical protein
MRHTTLTLSAKKFSAFSGIRLAFLSMCSTTADSLIFSMYTVEVCKRKTYSSEAWTDFVAGLSGYVNLRRDPLSVQMSIQLGTKIPGNALSPRYLLGTRHIPLRHFTVRPQKHPR